MSGFGIGHFDKIKVFNDIFPFQESLIVPWSDREVAVGEGAEGFKKGSSDRNFPVVEGCRGIVGKFRDADDTTESVERFFVDFQHEIPEFRFVKFIDLIQKVILSEAFEGHDEKIVVDFFHVSIIWSCVRCRGGDFL